MSPLLPADRRRPRVVRGSAAGRRRPVLARSEDAAVYIADARARVTHQPTWVYGQYGPGAANIAGSLAEPYWSSSPVIALTSAMRRQHRYRLEYQELDQPQLFTAVTKWQAEASTPQQIVQAIRAGALRAVSGTPRPVYVGIANDLTNAEFDGAVPDARADLASRCAGVCRSRPLFSTIPPGHAISETNELSGLALRFARVTLSR